MEIDLSSPSTLTTPSQGPSQTVVSNFTANTTAAVQIHTQVQAPILNDVQINHFDPQLPNKDTQQQQQNAAPENSSLSPLEQRVLNNEQHQH